MSRIWIGEYSKEIEEAYINKTSKEYDGSYRIHYDESNEDIFYRKNIKFLREEGMLSFHTDLEYNIRK